MIMMGDFVVPHIQALAGRTCEDITVGERLILQTRVAIVVKLSAWGRNGHACVSPSFLVALRLC